MDNKIFGLDIRSLVLFRISLGCLLLYDLIFFKLANFSQLYSAASGVMGASYPKFFSQSFISIPLTSDTSVLLFLGLAGVIYVLFALGIWMPFTTLFTYLFFLFIDQKFSFLVFGFDQYILVLLLFSAFLPLSRKYSLSAIKNNEVRGITVWGLLIQISVIYFFNSINKLDDLWLNGSAVNYSLADTVFSTSFSYTLLKMPLLGSLLNYFTLVFEFTVPILLFFPFKNQSIRLFLSILILLFHWGIFACMDVGHFPLVGTCVALLLIPSNIWNRLERRKQIFKPTASQWNAEFKTLVLKLSPLKKIIIGAMIFYCIEKNVFYFIDHNITLSENESYQALHKKINPLNNISQGTISFFSQSWPMFSSPSKELGFLTIEGQHKSGKLVNLSSINPFAGYTNFKCYSKNDFTRLLTFKIRNFLTTEQTYFSKPEIKNMNVLFKVWVGGELNRIKKTQNLADFKNVDIVLYSCKADTFFKYGRYAFNRIVVYKEPMAD